MENRIVNLSEDSYFYIGLKSMLSALKSNTKIPFCILCTQGCVSIVKIKNEISKIQRDFEGVVVIFNDLYNRSVFMEYERVIVLHSKVSVLELFFAISNSPEEIRHQNTFTISDAEKKTAKLLQTYPPHLVSKITGLSIKTISNHKRSAMRKIGVSNRFFFHRVFIENSKLFE